MTQPQTPAAEWREQGHADPHGTRYNCERAALTMGDMTDDQLANAVYTHGDTKPSLQDLLKGEAHMPIAYLTAAKDRIRWLSRALEASLAEADRLRHQVHKLQEPQPIGWHLKDATGKVVAILVSRFQVEHKQTRLAPGETIEAVYADQDGAA